MVQSLIQALAELLACLIEKLQDLLSVQCIVDSIVIWLDCHFILLHFNSLIKLQVCISLSIETLSVSNTVFYVVITDEIKHFTQSVCSLILNIINVELALRQHSAQLNETEIYADDFDAKKLINKVDNSDTDVNADVKVKDVLQLLNNEYSEETVIKQKIKDVM